MASFIYTVRTNQKDSETDVKIRIRLSHYFNAKRKEIYALSGVVVEKRAWDAKKACIKDVYTSATNPANEGNKYTHAKTDLEEIKSFVFQRTNGDLELESFSSEWLQGIVDDYWNIRKQIQDEEKKAIEEVKNKETLNEYIKRYLKEIEDGSRLTNKNTVFAPGTVKAVKGSMVQFTEFQKHQKIKLDFDDITLDFYRKYISWMTKKKYSSNTIGRHVKDLKTVMDNAKDENLHDNDEYKNKKFKVTSEEADNVYLTFDELKAIMEVDLSGKAKGYSDARDVFLAGCWLAQRVSDYNHMIPENIITEKIKTIEGDRVVESEAVYILLVQQKTKTKVKIPANRYMRDLLIRYNNQLPYIWEQKLNQYIKDVAEMAGITELVPITSTKGGKEETTLIAKNKLIKSHTARRTGATLMYLSGMDIYDICKITGHTSVKNLRKYIKADELDVAEKIRKYNYFN